jgi:hypothetical protein
VSTAGRVRPQQILLATMLACALNRLDPAHVCFDRCSEGRRWCCMCMRSTTCGQFLSSMAGSACGCC